MMGQAAQARHGIVCRLWTPAPKGYRPRVWSRRLAHCGAQVPHPTEGLTPADPEWWVNAISALPIQLQHVLFDPVMAGPRRTWLWLARAAPETAPAFEPALAFLNAERERLIANDDERLQTGRRRRLQRRYVAAAQKRVRGRGMFASGNAWGRRFADEVARILATANVGEDLLHRAPPYKKDFEALAQAHAHWSLTHRQRGRLAVFLWAAAYGWRVLGPEYERRFGTQPPMALARLGEACTREAAA